MKKYTESQVAEAVAIVKAHEKETSNPKVKKYRWKRFWLEVRSFFYNKQAHRLRKGPWLMLFMINIMAITCAFGWTIVAQRIAGKAVDIKDFIAFATSAGAMFMNIFSIIRYKKLANDKAIGVMASTTNSVVVNKSPSQPVTGPGVPNNKKIANGDNR